MSEHMVETKLTFQQREPEFRLEMLPTQLRGRPKQRGEQERNFSISAFTRVEIVLRSIDAPRLLPHLLQVRPQRFVPAVSPAVRDNVAGTAKRPTCLFEAFLQDGYMGERDGCLVEEGVRPSRQSAYMRRLVERQSELTQLDAAKLKVTCGHISMDERRVCGDSMGASMGVNNVNLPLSVKAVGRVLAK